MDNDHMIYFKSDRLFGYTCPCNGEDSVPCLRCKLHFCPNDKHGEMTCGFCHYCRNKNQLLDTQLELELAIQINENLRSELARDYSYIN